MADIFLNKRIVDFNLMELLFFSPRVCKMTGMGPQNTRAFMHVTAVGQQSWRKMAREGYNWWLLSSWISNY